MNIKQIKSLITRIESNKKIQDFAEGYVNYDTGEWLFDHGFNTPCETFFNRVDAPAEHPAWEVCENGKFRNYPDVLIIRYRFARPSYIQVLEWFEEKFNAKIDITSTKITIKNLHIPHGPDSHYVESWEYIVSAFPASDPVFLAGQTMNMIIDRFKLLAEPFMVNDVIKEDE